MILFYYKNGIGLRVVCKEKDQILATISTNKPEVNAATYLRNHLCELADSLDFNLCYRKYHDYLHFKLISCASSTLYLNSFREFIDDYLRYMMNHDYFLTTPSYDLIIEMQSIISYYSGCRFLVQKQEIEPNQLVLF